MEYKAKIKLECLKIANDQFGKDKPIEVFNYAKLLADWVLPK